MNELLPLSHKEQRRILHGRVAAYLDALTRVEARRKVYQEVKDAWQTEKERSEGLLEQLGKYLGDRREHVVAVVDDSAYLLRRVEGCVKLVQVPLAKQGTNDEKHS